LVEVLAAAMLIAGVVPPLETTGAVPQTDVTVPEPLPLNVFQSVEVKYPLVDVDAAAMLMAGVLPPLDTTGAVPVTDVTVPPLDGLVFVTVIAPDALVMEMPVPADNVVRVNPEPLPISSAPFAGVVVRPVPPEATARVADRPAAVPVVF